MAPKSRKTKQQLEEELEYHIATDWADFRRYAPKKENVLHEAVLRFSEGPFWGTPIPSVPAWYLDLLCTGGENYLLWRDKALSAALSKMGYRKVDVPPLQAPSIPPVAGYLWPRIGSPGLSKATQGSPFQNDNELLPPPPRETSNTPVPDYSVLANIARDAADTPYLLTPDDATAAAAEGPGLHLQSEIDRSRSYDAAIKRKLYGLRTRYLSYGN